MFNIKNTQVGGTQTKIWPWRLHPKWEGQTKVLGFFLDTHTHTHTQSHFPPLKNPPDPSRACRQLCPGKGQGGGRLRKRQTPRGETRAWPATSGLLSSSKRSGSRFYIRTSVVFQDFPKRMEVQDSRCQGAKVPGRSHGSTSDLSRTSQLGRLSRGSRNKCRGGSTGANSKSNAWHPNRT